MKNVVDASAVLAVCKQEAGAAEARQKMRGGFISAVNLSEVYYKASQFGKRRIADAIIQTAELDVVPFDRELAMMAADLAAVTRGKGISFADRACLALGLKTNAPILTADNGWKKLELSVELVMFRPELN